MRTPRFWQRRGLLSTLLQPAAALYGIGARYDRTHTTPQRANLPVISIGNTTAGGAGKTPTAIAMAHLLREHGHTPHLITRGYGAAATATHRVVPGDHWQQVGDEALLLAEAAPTWIGRQRLASANAAQAAGASLAIADDALQHHALHKDLSLLVIDGAFGIGNGRLLPAGPLREPFADALHRADALLIIGDDAQNMAAKAQGKPVFHARLVATAPDLANKRLLAFAGIARPEKFYTTLRGLGAELVATQDFPDHHPFAASELDALIAAAGKAQATPIATAKDGVKFPPPYRDQIAILPVRLQFDDPVAIQNWLQSALPKPI